MALTRNGFSEDVMNSGKPKKYTCRVCGKHFRSKFHFDSICNLCWVDSEMKPYATLGRVRGPRLVN